MFCWSLAPSCDGNFGLLMFIFLSWQIMAFKDVPMVVINQLGENST